MKMEGMEKALQLCLAEKLNETAFEYCELLLECYGDNPKIKEIAITHITALLEELKGAE